MDRRSPIDGGQRTQGLMPPSSEHIIWLDVLLLIVRALLFTLVERVLQADVRLDLPLRRLLAQYPRDVERFLYLHLRDFHIKSDP